LITISEATAMSEKALTKPIAAILPYAWVILWVVYFASVAAPLNQFKVPPILPVLMQTYQINLAQAGALMSVIALVGLILALPAGIILQRWGPRPTGLVALGCIAAGAGMGALSNSYGVLMTSRVVEGVGMGLIGVVAPATIAMWFPPERQGGPMGIWATWVPVGTVVMYVLAPLLVSWRGLPAVWWFGALFAVVMFVIYAAFIRRPPAQAAEDKSGAEPLDLRKALANRNIWLLALEFACFNLALVSLGTYYPTFLNEARGYILGTAAIVASIGTMVVLVSAPLAGWVSDRIGSRRLVFSLPFLALAVLLILPFRVTGGAIIAVMVVQGLIAGAIPTATFAAAPEVMRKPEWAGLGLAVILIGQNLGQLIGPVWFGQLVNSLGWVAAGNLLIVVCLVGFVSAWMVKIR
jgi:predicted MFS family arabinose efflux permease